MTEIVSGPARDPISELLSRPEESVLAVIVGVEGPSYRPVGATMAIFADGARAGTLSSGCVESDIALHGLDTLERGRPTVLRYGRGSPFIDIQLPCGGGLDILLLPRPDREALGDLAQRRAARQPCTLEVAEETGAMAIRETGETGRDAGLFRLRCLPELRFLVFGKGPEASTFAALVKSAGYPNMLLSPDAETLEEAARAGSETRHLVRPFLPEDVAVDAWTAIVLFFHDHDWEPPILEGALATKAFYIGAQGSQRARDARLLMLEGMGVPEDARARLHGPVGLIPSARDARTLAVSVLAEILAEAPWVRA
ncbi:XdhC family protein [Tropicimonas sediminicola]|uniref:XdhC family protein n=1 Tax=Tropicimonas sediminicola TaxID=1031541 RepID=UPI000B79532B|nr:XdhC family protein [Tropicimonas sediminicola]